ncbi:MAG: N-6 DNA methylase [Colwellia sp.]|nr:N-6 DNA methylase [Colwellia sp.]
MNQTPNNLAAFCWSIADLLRGDFKQSQYGRIILPFTLLRRLEGVLEESKDAVLAEYEKIQKINLPEEAQEKLLLRATGGLNFFNTSKMNMSKLGESDIKANLESYIQAFSKDAREIFEYFNFAEFISQLNDADLLWKVVQRVRTTDLSPKVISNHDMGLTFEELIRRFAEGSNETAGEHFTPRDIVRLTTSLVFMKDDDALTKSGTIRTIYDPTVGTGGFLSSGMEYVHELNPQAVIRAYGQELNPESYAICKAGMLMKGQDVTNIKLGNTLSNDQLYDDKFDYMLSNPPFGVDWKKIDAIIKDENTLKGFDGRFGAGLPRVSDGSLLFLMHLLSKLRDASEGGGRIGIILNGSPLFTGGAGSGESEIRRYILEADLLETIVALPTDMFYNTGNASYVWVLSNKKSDERKGKVQLINGVNLYGKMRKSLGSKRNEMSADDIAIITRACAGFESISPTSLAEIGLDKQTEKKSHNELQSSPSKTDTPKTFASKIFATHEFAYRRITIEHPLRESYQFSNERIAELRFAAKQLNAPMKWIYETYGTTWTDSEDCPQTPTANEAGAYGVLTEHETNIRKHLKNYFSEIKEAKIKELLDPKLWITQKQLMLKAKLLQKSYPQGMGTYQCNNMNGYEMALKAACKVQKIKLLTKEIKQITAAVSWKNAQADKVIKKVHRPSSAYLPLGHSIHPEHKDDVLVFYGIFKVGNQYVEYKSDSDLRDNENVATDPNQSVNALNEAYFKKEIQPNTPDAWIDSSKRDSKDKKVGIVGYDINFKKCFFEARVNNWEGDVTELVRCKDIFSSARNSSLGIDTRSLKISKIRSIDNRRLHGINIDNSKLNINYFNYFIETEAGKDWSDSLKSESVMPYITFNKLIEAKFPLPPMAHQRRIVDLNNDYIALLEKFRVMQSGLITDPDEFEQQLEPHLNATQRYQDDFQYKLPHPLAILWNQANSALTEKEACEGYCKFYEYLGNFLTSIAFGFLDVDKVNKDLTKSKKPKSLSMGFAYNRLKEFSNNTPKDFPEGMKSIYSNQMVCLLKAATKLRNDISHRGLPSGQEVKVKYRELEVLNKSVQLLLKDFFVNYTLFMPISSVFDGTQFEYIIETLDGLALNPPSLGKLYTDTPLIDGKLYIGSIEESEITTAYPLFPLMIVEETIEDTNFMAFYFYTDYIDEQLRFVCPYPNVVTYKFKKTNFWTKA